MKAAKRKDTKREKEGETEEGREREGERGVWTCSRPSIDRGKSQRRLLGLIRRLGRGWRRTRVSIARRRSAC